MWKLAIEGCKIQDTDWFLDLLPGWCVDVERRDPSKEGIDVSPFIDMKWIQIDGVKKWDKLSKTNIVIADLEGEQDCRWSTHANVI